MLLVCVWCVNAQKGETLMSGNRIYGGLWSLAGLWNIKCSVHSVNHSHYMKLWTLRPVQVARLWTTRSRPFIMHFLVANCLLLVHARNKWQRKREIRTKMLQRARFAWRGQELNVFYYILNGQPRRISVPLDRNECIFELNCMFNAFRNWMNGTNGRE